MDSDAFDIRPALYSDEQAIRALLEKADLPFEDVQTGRQTFLVAVNEGHIVGSVGLEAYGESGLFLSLAVETEFRGRGLGGKLTEEMVAEAQKIGARELYLLTMAAAPFFAKHGFEKVERSKAPAALQGTTEFALLCPVSSACMRRRL
ncbi:MAG: arsenic resistance N-acetyltransferase ArsN2 [Methanocella sp.]